MNKITLIGVVIFSVISTISFGKELNIGVSKDGAGGSNNLKTDNLEVIRGGYAIGEGINKIEIPYSYQISGTDSEKVVIKLDLKQGERQINILNIIVLLENLPLKFSFPEGINFWIHEVPEAVPIEKSESN